MKTLPRDKTLDIAKGICIILMVLGHSGCPTYLYNFIYMFHMPCFFFISGWLLNDKYLSDLKKGLFQKAKASYYPFVKWTLIFLLFHNVFASLHIYDTSYTLPMFAEKVVRAFTLTGSEQLLGGFWFLISLFWASAASLLFLSFLQKCHILTRINISGGVIFILLITPFWHYLPNQIPQMFREQTLLATAFYLSGYLCRNLQMQFKHSSAIGTTWLFVPALVALFIELNMVLVKGWLILLDYVIAILGILGVMYLSGWLTRKKIASVLAYIGNKTLYILIFHFLAFKIVSSLYLYVHGLPITMLPQFPVLNEVPLWMSAIYTVIGIVFPLFAWIILHKLQTIRFAISSKIQE